MNKINVKVISQSTSNGVSKNGNPWTKHQVIAETLDQYPKKICFVKFGDMMQIENGGCYCIEFSLSSRSWVDASLVERWSTDVVIESIAPAMVAPQAPQATQVQPVQQPQPQQQYAQPTPQVAVQPQQQVQTAMPEPQGQLPF